MHFPSSKTHWPKFLLFLVCLCLAGSGIGQTNAGFLGKKMAFGFNKQLCPLQTFDAIYGNYSPFRTLTNNELFFEYSTSKYRSVAFQAGFQKVPVYDGGTHTNLTQDLTYQGDYYRMNYEVQEGYALVRMLSFGLRYNFYARPKTINSPIGFSQYLKFDVFANRILENQYIYQTAYTYNIDYDQYEYAIGKLNRSYENATRISTSLGYGIESKKLLSRNVFVRLNAEFNLSLRVFKRMAEEESSTSFDEYTVNDQMDDIARNVNIGRNLFLFGAGLGLLL